VTKEKKPSITALHPGSADVAKAMGWTIEVARVVAEIPGCPRVKGGKGKRFTSIQAFVEWFDALPLTSKLKVPEIDRLERLRLGEEVAKLTWFDFGDGEDDSPGKLEARRLATDYDYPELVEMRDRWRDRDQHDKGESAAKAALRGLA
jgi:hypothetical protein